MIVLALPLVAAAATLFPDTRSFWTVVEGPHPQPVQEKVTAHLARAGEKLVVYEEEGYHFSSAGED
ncbi:MAG: hypothetical protein ACHQHM_06360, partial [Thermoanaerobaculales bacterium]